MEDVLQKIVAATGLAMEEVERRVAEKQRELSGFVSKEGAAYIVAKEMGLDLIGTGKKRTVKISEIVNGNNNVAFDARVLRVFEAREFEKNGRKFRVGNLLLGDETGTVRLSLWDEQIGLGSKIAVGDCIEVSGAYSKEGPVSIEVRLGRRGNIKRAENVELPSAENILKKEGSSRVSIEELKEGKVCEIRAALMQIFETENIFDVCPECGGKIKYEGGKYLCVKHSAVVPRKSMVVNGVADDGSGNIRLVMFGDVGLHLLGLTMDQVMERRGKVFDGLDLIGTEFVFSGRVRKNQMFDRLEFVVSGIAKLEMEKEISTLINALSAK
ncbi:MAG: DUF2240 family protein [Candidatus Aenigmarchaeota archaeon]|nr:DUF2240 family protein [Candidatus Aenigmarchaeota archaeon]